MPTVVPTARDATAPDLAPYDLVMVAVSLLALFALVINALFVTHPEAARLLEFADLLFCGVFLLDFLRRLISASDRRAYLLKSGWLDLASSLPAVSVLRVGRLVRIAQLVRVLRGARALRTIGQTLARRKGASAFVTTALISFTTLLFGSIAILHAERGAGANIQSASDAIWWAFVTITTVGYGDLYPVTTAGRATAAVLMVVGVGLFGTMSGLFASWLVHRERDEAREVALLREEIRELKAMLERR
jgi:voltage-gated potassium channel